MICAIYCRLSKEDEEKNGESESIQNQKSLLINYALQKQWQIYKIYSDEDYSGIDRERPQFKQLIKDAQARKFDIILCKTQSRFTRDMEIVERFIHNKFILWGIRFVAVVDNADSSIKGNKKARQINGLINEWYLEDLSENIKVVLDHKRQNGQYIASFPLYGYQKDPSDHHCLIIDEEAARVVEKIFNLYLAGHGKQHIADRLNQEGIVNPTRYKQQKGMLYRNGYADNHSGLWNKTTIGRILKNEMYIGTLVQGIKRKINYKSDKFINVPQEKWIKVVDNHQPIIAKETFALVQKMMSERVRSNGRGSVHILAGKARCLDCKSLLSKTSNGKGQSYLSCRSQKNCCTRHSIRLDKLTDIVSLEIKDHLDKFYDLPDIKKLCDNKEINNKKASLQKQINSLEHELKKRSHALKTLYLDKCEGIISQEEFIALSEDFRSEKKSLAQRLNNFHLELAAFSSLDEDNELLLQDIQKFLQCEDISRDLITLLIDSIEIGENQPTEEQQIVINWLI
ncbi:MAG: recombinase family protein [Bacillota bacterium]|jgi:site-specific DNA recombinase